MIRIERLRDPFRRPEDRDPSTLYHYREGLRIAQVVPGDFDLEAGNVVILNNRSLTGAEVDSTILRDGDVILLADVPGILVSIFGFSVLAKILDAVIILGISIGLSMGISALMAPKDPTSTKFGDQSDGPARNWEGIQDTVGAGRPIPFIYGEIRTGGQFLQSFERLPIDSGPEGTTMLYTLLGIARGPIESISLPQINGNLIETIPDVSWEARMGTPDQEGFDGFGEIAHEVIQQRAILKADGWLSFVTMAPVQAFEITWRFPSGLLEATREGEVISYDTSFTIEYRPWGESDPYQASGPITKIISGASRNPLKAQLRIDGLQARIYEIRIIRNTADDVDVEEETRFVSSSEIYAITEILYEPRAHPGLAMVALRELPSEQVNSSVPTNYTFLVKGFNDVRIYSDETHYTVGWSENNSWCAAHFIVSPHGLGDKYGWGNIHLPSFLAFAAYCDALVPDGKGGMEKRCTFGHVFDTVKPSDEQLAVFVQGCGALLIRRGNLWRVEIDEPGEMVWVGTEGNIVPGTLKLSYLPAGELANRLTLTFANRDLDYQRDPYPEEDPTLSPGDRYVDASRDLWGVTRISQVQREARRILGHNRADLTQVELETGLDSLGVTVGRIFGVCLPTTAVGLASGRLRGVDSSGALLTLDEEVTLEVGKTYEITVLHLSGDSIEVKRIVTPAGFTDRVATADVAWISPPSAGDLYALGEVGYSVEKFRCIEVSMGDGFRRKIRGNRYDPSVYSFDLEVMPEATIPSVPDPRLLPPPVAELEVRERIEYSQDGSLRAVLDVDWTRPISGILDHAEIWIRSPGSSAWTRAGESAGAHFTIASGIASPGYTYEVAVVTVSTAGMRRSPEASPRATVTTEGSLVQPPDLAGLQAILVDGTLILSVDPLAEEDLGPSGYYEWRRGSTWTQSALLGTSRAPRFEFSTYARGSAVILAVAVNSVGNRSAHPASTSIDIYGQIQENVILEDTAEPTWAGTVDVLTREIDGTLSLEQPSTATPFIRGRRLRRARRRMGWGAPAATPRLEPSGWYTSPKFEVSSSGPARARPDLQVTFEAIYVGLGTFDLANYSFDDPRAQVPFSGFEGDARVRVEVESRYSATDSEDSSFSPWAPHQDRGEILLTWYQYRIHLLTDTPAYSGKLTGARLSIDVPDKVTSGRQAVLSAAPVTVTYPVGYYVEVKRLIASLEGGAVGDTLRITAEGAAGFTAEIRTSAGALTTGTIHYDARGY